MKIFDDLIGEVGEILEPVPLQATPAHCEKAWSDVGYNQVVLQRDSAYELSGVGFNLVTSAEVSDEIAVFGEELNEIRRDRSFARISVIQIDDVDDEQKTYDLIKKIEYTKYKCFPDGYMIRTSSKSHKEAVRVSKKSLKSGMTFKNVGELIINKYKEIPAVKGVKLIFVTDLNADYRKLEEIAQKNSTITEAFNHIMNDLNFDCDTCNLKAICDEVEGMKEMHFKASSKKEGMS